MTEKNKGYEIRLKLLPEFIKGKLTNKKKLTIEKYSSNVKFKSILRWRSRMARNGISTTNIALDIGVAVPRVSEWLSFKCEPKEVNFLKVEKYLHKMGA